MADLSESSRLRDALQLLLRPYAQILFSSDLRTGALVLAAIASFPRLAVATLFSIAVASAVTLAFGFGSERLREGGYACTAVLTTLAIGVFDPGAGEPFALVAIGAVLAVLLSASFEAAFASLTLPPHSFPFIAATWIVHLSARSLPARSGEWLLYQPLNILPDAWLSASWLDLPAALIFVHGSSAGLLVILAILLHSRIALLLAFLGATSSLAMRWWLRSDAPWSLSDTVAGFNGILSAMAIGGIWFVPQRSSLILGAGSAAIAAVLAYGLTPLVGKLYLPVLSLPFIATTHLLLMAARRRQADRKPHSAIPTDRPEEALSKHLMRMRRFGDAAWLPFRLPFHGEWIVTQGHDGEHTHKGLWRHGLDFEGVGRDGNTHQGEGGSLNDYYCYNLPVVAAGAGTVTKIVDGVDDNPPGVINTDDNWGNAVIVAHGLGLYSVYAHLKAKSIRVKQGEVVGAGDELARCGNSGRSPVPHLHFQVQRALPLGSPTINADFGDVVSKNDGYYELKNQVVPAQGDVVRPILRDESLARALSFQPTSKYVLTDTDSGRREVARVEVDLLGRRILTTDSAKLYLEPYDGGIVLVDFEGDPKSLLRFLLLALARMPFDKAKSLHWKDNLSRRFLLPTWLRAAADFSAVLSPTGADTEVSYHYEREAGKVVIVGTSARWHSRAELCLRRGAHQITVKYGSESRTISLEPAAQSQAGASS